LHERTGLASIVIKPEQLKSFHPGWAKPERVLPQLFLKKVDKDEGKELLMQALDWQARKESKARMEKIISQRLEKPSEIESIQTKGKQFGIIEKINEENFPPCIKQILQGMKQDGRKRALFILINFLRSVNLSFEEVEKKLFEWNTKNYKPLRDGYIKTQLAWFRKQDKRLPPNCSMQAYYQDSGVCMPDALCKKIKNPVNYAMVKTRIAMGMKSEKGEKPKKRKSKKDESKT
jgi:DNA primase large subunit